MDSITTVPDSPCTLKTTVEIETKGGNGDLSPERRSVSSRKQNGGLRGSVHLALSSVNKSASQNKKPPPHRRNVSPLNWFPRIKVDSFLKRKLRLLQEVGGMSSSLDETLGKGNPHYSRIEREKIAAKEAARNATLAHKTAMVEASWCRILKAARIKSNNAEAELEKAEKRAAEAFEEAKKLGVMMYDTPDCRKGSCEIESSSVLFAESTHKVAASFESAFNTDKEVAAAVRKAFIQLAHCPSSSNKDEFKDLLHKISQNPDSIEIDQGISDVLPNFGPCPESKLGVSQDETDDVEQSEPGCIKLADDQNKNSFDVEQSKPGCVKLADDQNESSFDSFEELVNVMFDRMKDLQEDQLASLATIVATCGLNAVLIEVNNSKDLNLQEENTALPGPAAGQKIPSQGAGRRRHSCFPGFMNPDIKVTVKEEVPSLDKFLVKHFSRLEREVQEAKNARKRLSVMEHKKTLQDPNTLIHPNKPASTSDFGSIFKKHIPRFVREIQREKRSQQNVNSESVTNSQKHDIQDSDGMSTLGNVPSSSTVVAGSQMIDLNPLSLAKDAEQNITEAAYEMEEKQSQDSQSLVFHPQNPISLLQSGDKENIDSNRLKNIDDEQTEYKKPMSRLERAKLEVIQAFSRQCSIGTNDADELVGLETILLKSTTSLERGKTHKSESRADDEEKTEVGKRNMPIEKSGPGLGEILVKHQSKLEKAKLEAARCPVDQKKHVNSTKERRERDLLEEWGGLGLADSTSKHHLSKLESHQHTDVCLDVIENKDQPQIEDAKLMEDHQPLGPMNYVNSFKERRDKELKETWGGFGLKESIKPHVSRLERDKAAWRKAEEEGKKGTMEEH